VAEVQLWIVGEYDCIKKWGFRNANRHHKESTVSLLVGRSCYTWYTLTPDSVM
jgi:hypothetical protein